MYDRQRIIGAPCSGTGTWFLHTSEYTTWLNAEHRFLWLKGKAGAGKSTLMKRSLDDLRSQPAHSTTIICAYFFDRGGVELEKSTSGLLRTILHGIFTQNPLLLEQFVGSSDDGRLIKGKNLQWRVEELKEVISISARLSNWKPTILFLDALDEGPKDELRPLLFFFEQLCQSEDETEMARKLRICLSSRHYPNVTIKNCPEVWAERHNHSDIEQFAVQRLAHITNMLGNQPLVQSVLDQADGVFLWVDLVTNLMLADDDNGETRAKKLETLRKSPNGLDDLYTQVLRELSPVERAETFQIFKWALYASRRLRAKELCFALHCEHSRFHITFAAWRESDSFVEEGAQMEKFIRSRSRGLLEIRSVSKQSTSNAIPESQQVVHFIHQSVPEFLLRVGFAILVPAIDILRLPGLCHHQIALTSIEYLSKPEILNGASMKVLRYFAKNELKQFTTMGATIDNEGGS